MSRIRLSSLILTSSVVPLEVVQGDKREKESAIWQEMRQRPDYGMNEDKSIESIIDERQRARELLESADTSLDAFDWVDDGTGNFVPREEVEA